MMRRAGPVLALLAAAATADAASFVVNRIDTARVGSAYAIAAAPDGTMFVAGAYLRSGTPAVPFAGIWRYGPNGGSPVWTLSATGLAGGTSLFEEAARAIAIGPGSGTAYDIFVGGALYDANGQQADLWLARYTSAGSPVWTKTINGAANEDDVINAIAVAPSGEVIVAGRRGNAVGNSDAWVARWTADGRKQAEYSLPAFIGADEEALAVATDASGSIYVAGYITLPGDGKNAWVAKFSAALSGSPLQWGRTLNGASSSTDFFTGVAVDPASGALYVAGVTTGPLPFTDILVKRFDAATGDQVWTRTIDGGEGDHDAASACALAPDGDLVVAGFVDRPTGAFTDIWVARFAPDGATRWELTRTNLNDYIDEARGVTVDALGTIRAAGFVRGYQTPGPDDPRPWIGTVLESPAGSLVVPAAGAYAMPNPWRPGSGGAFDAAAITIRGLPAGATVRVYTVTGARVVELADADRDGLVTWDAKGGGGDPVASGVYLWVADGGSAGIARGKVVIVR